MRFPSVAARITIACVAANAFAHSDRALVQEAVIDAPVAEVWKLFTTSEGARQWMAPRIEIDLRVGGDFRSSYNPQSTLDDEHTIINRTLSYLPERMLSIQNVQAPAGFQHPELFIQTWSVMTFNVMDEQRTRVRIAGLNYGEGAEWDVLYAHFERGNAYLLRLLAEVASAHVGSWSNATNAVGGDSLVSEVTVRAPLSRAWRAWTSEAGLRPFFAPQSKVDLRIGGLYEMYFDAAAPEGQRGSEGCRILAYEPQRMLSFSWNAPPHLPFAREHHTWVVLEFDEVDEGTVRVRLTHLGFNELKAAHPAHAAEFDQARTYFERAWPHLLQSMREHLERDGS
jgi:uncharacterized protein YndB with AHSA1/START domain